MGKKKERKKVSLATHTYVRNPQYSIYEFCSTVLRFYLYYDNIIRLLLFFEVDSCNNYISSTIYYIIKYNIRLLSKTICDIFLIEMQKSLTIFF